MPSRLIDCVRPSFVRRPDSARAHVAEGLVLNVTSKAEAVRVATEFMELHRKYWPEFEGKSEVRPLFEPGEGP